MPDLVFADSFIADVAKVESRRVRDGIMGRIALLSDFPDLGSSRLPESVSAAFGSNVKKLSTPPFLTIYEHDKGNDRVCVLALVHSRRAR